MMGWKDSLDGGKDKLGIDGKDGSFRAEKMSPGKDGMKDHDHHVVKGSTDGKIKEVYKGDKSKR